MCGIIGAWSRTKPFSDQEFSRAVDSLSHRGPDGKGIFTENNFFLGMRRLTVIDLKTGDQPIFNENRTKLVLFNGEIYNYKELIPTLHKKGHEFRTNSDTEVIVHSLEDGLNTINTFRGMFAISYFDREKQKLVLVRDRVGVKPLYYYYLKGKLFLYSSEIKGLLAMLTILNIQPEINEEAIYHYLSLSNIPQPQTIYKNVLTLMPGSTLTLQDGELEIRKYWNYDYQPKWNYSFDETKVKLQELIHESVKLRLRSDVPLGIFLSGGLDSSIVAYEAAKISQNNIETFTISIKGNNKFDESVQANETAKAIGVKNTILPLEIVPLRTLLEVAHVYDQPFADPSAIPSLAISQLASKYVKVILNGDGGDEQFAGYRRYGLAKNIHLIPNLYFVNNFLPQNKDRRTFIGFLKRILRVRNYSEADRYIALTTDLLFDSEKSEIWKGSENLIGSTAKLIQSEYLAEASYLDRVMHLDRNFNLLSGLLVKMDMATSAYSIEGRSPFLDHELFEFSSKIPDSFKYRGFQSKYILRNLYKEKLPIGVIKGAKKGFEIPLLSWLKSDFKPVINEITSRHDLKLYNYLDKTFVDTALHFNSYQDKNQAYMAYSILMLAIWLDKDLF